MVIIIVLLLLLYWPAYAVTISSGWDSYCRRTNDCHAGEPMPFNGKLADLVRVNREINAAARWQPEHFDQWYDVTEIGYGDCEDFALAKRGRLIRLGWPRANLPIAFTRNAAGAAHAVLFARSNDRWYVLDQASPDVLPLEDSPYRSWLLEPVHGRIWSPLRVH